MMMPNGLSIFGAWVLIVQVAAKCPVRGTLADADGPLDEADLAIKTGCSPDAFTEAFRVLSDPRIGWIVVERWESAGSALPLQTNKTSNTNPPTANDEFAAASGSRVGGRDGGNGFASWGAVSHRLQSLKASRWREAIAEAKQCGCDPILAANIIDHGERHGYGVGAIICRLCKAGPHLPVDAGWPDVPQPASVAPATPDPREASEQLRFDIIKAGQKSGKPRETIDQELIAAGLEP
jgi:hypothetical protein